MTVVRFLERPCAVRVVVTGPLRSAYTRNRPITLITKAQTEQLLANWDAQIARMDNELPDIDFKLVVKLFTPDAQWTWLLTELGRDDIAFGLCDLGLGMPELGFVSMTELRTVRGPLGLPVERDRHFEADQPISAFVDEARAHSRIVT